MPIVSPFWRLKTIRRPSVRRSGGRRRTASRERELADVGAVRLHGIEGEGAARDATRTRCARRRASRWASRRRAASRVRFTGFEPSRRRRSTSSRPSLQVREEDDAVAPGRDARARLLVLARRRGGAGPSRPVGPRRPAACLASRSELKRIHAPSGDQYGWMSRAGLLDRLRRSGAVLAHDVDLVVAVAVRHERDPRVVRRPVGKLVVGGAARERAVVRSVRVHHVELPFSGAVRLVEDPGAVFRPARVGVLDAVDPEDLRAERRFGGSASARGGAARNRGEHRRGPMARTSLPACSSGGCVVRRFRLHARFRGHAAPAALTVTRQARRGPIRSTMQVLQCAPRASGPNNGEHLS